MFFSNQPNVQSWQSSYQRFLKMAAHTRGSSQQVYVSCITLKCCLNTLMMSCLYSPSSLFFPPSFTSLLSPTIHLMCVCSKCWCLSYVFSAFGLFSYCLPGLFGSSPPQPVWCFNALLCVLLGGTSLCVCLAVLSSFPTFCDGLCGVLRASVLLCCESYFFVTIQSQSSYRFYVACHPFSPVTAFIVAG